MANCPIAGLKSAVHPQRPAIRPSRIVSAGVISDSRVVNPRSIAMTGLLCALMLPACRPGQAAYKPLAGPPQTGALYSFNDGEGGFRVGKVLAREDDYVFVRWFGNRWTKRPALATAHHASNSTFVAFSTETFSGMQPVLLENGSVAAEETAEYEVWKQSNQTVF